MSIILLSLILLLSPFSGNYPLLHDSLLGLCILLAGWKLATKHEVRTNSAIPLLAILIFSSAIAVYQSIDLTAALKDVVQIICLCSLTILSLSLNRNGQQKVYSILRFVFFSMLALGIYAWFNKSQNPVWPFRNNYIYSVTLCASFPFVFYWIKSKLKYIALLFAPVLLLLAPLSVCLTLSGGMFCSAVLLSTYRKETISFPVLLLALCIGGYSITPGTFNKRGLNDLAIKEETELSQRYIEWVAAGRLWRENPVLGVGGGNYQKYIGENYQTLPKTNQMPLAAQNGWLVLAIEYGIGGLLSFAALLLLSLQSIWKKQKTNTADRNPPAVLLSFLILALSGIFTLMVTRETGPLFFILSGIALCAQPPQKTQTQ